MVRRTSAPEAFGSVLRSYQMGDLPFAEMLSRLTLLLSAGASRTALMKVFRGQESEKPLPDFARDAVADLLSESPFEPLTIDLDEIPVDTAKEGTADAHPAAVGDVLVNRFHLVKLIGTGGMSRVFKATDASAEADYGNAPFIAVKVLNRLIEGDPQAADGTSLADQAAFRAFQERLQPLLDLHHPNIVRFYGCERDGARVFMTLEYVAGRPLSALLKSARRSRSPAAGAAGAAPARLSSAPAARLPGGAPPLNATTQRMVVAAIAAGLEYAHERHVVHGDLKPGNVLISDREEVKILDFGNTSWTRARAQGASAAPVLPPAVEPAPQPVTPRYASPQMMARQEPVAADDVYALACMAYELFTGTHPFDNGAGEHTFRHPPPRRPELSAEEYAAIVHALRSDRVTRTPSIAQFMDELFPVRPRTADTDASVTQVPADEAVAPPPARRSRQLRAGLWGVAIAAMVLLGVWLRSTWQPTPSHAPPAASNAEPAAPNAATAVAPRTNMAPPTAIAPPSAAATPPGTVIRDCPTCPALVVLPAGHFTQGSPAAMAGAPSFERPAHAVVIAHSFALSANDITVGEFGEFVAATARDMGGCETYDGRWRYRSTASWRDPGFAQSPQHPVACISWDDAVAYAAWLSDKTAAHYRLPSAAEWEFAARAGGTAVRPWDSSAAACADANVADRSAEDRYPGWAVFPCEDGYVHTAPVGSFKPNSLGLYDMLGNVFQWTLDCWHADYSSAPTDGAARSEGDCSEHELRGGSWFSSPAYVRASYRNHFAANYRTSSVGFRVLRDLAP